MICDSCIHKEVCYEKEEDRRALKFCSDYFNFEEELEKIKNKLHEKSWTMIGIAQDRQLLDLYEVDNIINDRISELKGVQNE